MVTEKKGKNDIAVQLICHEALINESLKKKKKERWKMYVRLLSDMFFIIPEHWKSNNEWNGKNLKKYFNFNPPNHYYAPFLFN